MNCFFLPLEFETHFLFEMHLMHRSHVIWTFSAFPRNVWWSRADRRGSFHCVSHWILFRGPNTIIITGARGSLKLNQNKTEKKSTEMHRTVIWLHMTLFNQIKRVHTTHIKLYEEQRFDDDDRKKNRPANNDEQKSVSHSIYQTMHIKKFEMKRCIEFKCRVYYFGSAV